MAKWRDVKQKKINNKTKTTNKTQETKIDSCASLLSRLKAFLTDSFLITTPIIYIVMYLVLGGGEEFAQNRSFGWSLILGVIALIIIFFWYVKSETPGMKAYSLKIVNHNLKRVSFFQAIIRYIVTLLAISSIFLLLIPFFRKDRKTLQDIISNTLIIETNE